jgi:hypothetical protein
MPTELTVINNGWPIKFTGFPVELKENGVNVVPGTSISKTLHSQLDDLCPEFSPLFSEHR